ncbi:trafficking protein particle complex subunit 11-like [Stylophora pistillata]|uniref:trafficking protein particle complex subunit 11-like n=1 Tax=Stylophora pistillata TaxID=50429 RepID=UPI000C04FA91|nr:trafficking protein particle complex subunit 11-like [Stylophora pistillata]
MAAASEFPTELSTHPLGLIALMGLDVSQKPLHKAIWESFSVNRHPERVPLSFRLLPIDHEFPKAKSKRSTYEWYLPKGILKTKWMYKHLYLSPAVVVMFYELDWDDAQWKDRQTECASKLERVRTNLQDQNTKVAVVLIQKNAPLPPGDDLQALERAATLCSACDLSAKSLFVLPHTDHLIGYTISLENAFYDLAQSYYHGECRRVKAHKEFLNKGTHQLLLVRHQFKVAFFNELRQDPHSAIKHYRQAYSLLGEIKTMDMNMLEIKVVAGFINYKICRLSFQASAPLDAISQFRRHVDLFKEKVGCPDLAFEHSAWLSKQFSLFGELFDEAIRNGLTALQTQHPGFYYQQAANNAIVRRQLCQGLCHSTTPLNMNPLENAGNLDFYGHRPWRQGFQVLEKAGIIALQSQEIQVDHSWIIIPLLSSAVAQFKKYKSPRMKRYLMVQMGEEYYHARDYSKALLLLGKVTWDYRREKWWSLLTSVLITSLRCAYLVGNVEEYITLSLELMGRYVENSPEEKTRCQTNLIHVMSNECPEPEPGCDFDSVEEAKELWKTLKVTPQAPQVFTIQMEQIAPFVECKAVFDSVSTTADSTILLQIYLRVSCPFPIRFSKIAVFFSNQFYNQQCVVEAGSPQGEGGLYLLPAKTKVIPFQLVPQPEDVGKLLQVTSVALELGSRESRCAVLVWSGWGGETGNLSPPFVSYGLKSASKEDQFDWDDLKIISKIKIESRKPRVNITLKHEPPALVNEFYELQLVVESLEETPVKDLRVWLGFQDEPESPERGALIYSEVPVADMVERGATNFLDFTVDGITDKIERSYFIKCSQVGSRTVTAKITYTVDVQVEPNSSPVTCTCAKEESVAIKTVMPFEISLSLTNLKLERLDQLFEEEPFLLLAGIKCTSPWPVTMVATTLNMSPEVNIVGEEMGSQLQGISLQQGESASECYCLAVKEGVSKMKVVNIGSLALQWRRTSATDKFPVVVTELTFPSVTVESVPFAIQAELPAYGCVQTPLFVSYLVRNRTPQVQEVEVTVEPSDAFVYSGHRQIQFRLLPTGDHRLKFSLYPLYAGFVTLPKLHFNLPRFQASWDEHAQKLVPTNVFIKPRGRELVSKQKPGYEY